MSGEGGNRSCYRMEGHCLAQCEKLWLSSDASNQKNKGDALAISVGGNIGQEASGIVDTYYPHLPNTLHTPPLIGWTLNVPYWLHFVMALHRNKDASADGEATRLVKMVKGITNGDVSRWRFHLGDGASTNSGTKGGIAEVVMGLFASALVIYIWCLFHILNLCLKSSMRV